MNSQTQSNAPQAAHIVLDLETLSTNPHAAVASIGAVALTAEGTWVAEFHLAISTEDQHSRHVSPSTCEWWDEQSNEARAASILAPNPAAPTQALEEFTSWVLQIADPKKVKVWGNGSGFDNVILSSLFADYPELERPWAYWNDRDMRTVLDLNPAAKDVGPFEGVKHNALHDARHEAKQLAKVLMATQPAAQGMDAQQYRLIERGELIEAGDQFLRDDFTWQIDPRGIFVGVPHGAALRPARRALAAQAKQGEAA